MLDTYQTRAELTVNGKRYNYFSLEKLGKHFDITHLPISLKVVLENLLRHEDGINVKNTDIANLTTHATKQPKLSEIAYMPARVLLQDFTGVPAVVDFAAMRDAMEALGGDPTKINPLQPAELVIDHSVQVDSFGSSRSEGVNSQLEFDRNFERYVFLHWGQSAFANFKVVPPDTGIVHQVNLEYLARVVFGETKQGTLWAYPDTLVGTDSHTTMINGLGVLGWGVGGIEAEAAMLGQSMSMMIPRVVGFKLTGKLPEGATATDLVLVVTQMLRQKGVVNKFVEFYGDGLAALPLADRATIANMAPEYGATCGFFPVDAETLRYLKLSGRTAEQIDLVEAYSKAQGMFRDANSPEPVFENVLELDLNSVQPCIAGPKRPQDRVLLKDAKQQFAVDLAADAAGREQQPNPSAKLRDGSVVIAAITSCTNTSNPAVMLASGLLAKKAVAKGLTVPDYVKTSLAPGSLVVTEYLKNAGLMEPLEKLGFYLVGYGCTTCIGNSGPLEEHLSKEITENKLRVCSVLSGNRNFEGRIHPDVRMNYLASPPLVVAYALAGRMDIDFYNEPMGKDANGNPVFLRDIWPTQAEIHQLIEDNVQAGMFRKSYQDVFKGDARWNSCEVPVGDRYSWSEKSTYVRKPPYFEGMTAAIPGLADIHNARVLAKLGDSVTTDHISPAGSIKTDSPAGAYLKSHGVEPKDFNSYGSRRGNHEVMMRGTFANVRLKNQLAPGTEGGWTCYQPSGEQMSIYDAAMRYQAENVPTIILAGKEYGSGSSRDWAAKGPRLLGVFAVIAESYERIHRSNLVGMGVLPLRYMDGQNALSLGLSGQESYEILGLQGGKAKEVNVVATDASGHQTTFRVHVCLDTPQEVIYMNHGGILHYVLRDLAKAG